MAAHTSSSRCSPSSRCSRSRAACSPDTAPGTVCCSKERCSWESWRWWRVGSYDAVARDRAGIGAGTHRVLAGLELRALAGARGGDRRAHARSLRRGGAPCRDPRLGAGGVRRAPVGYRARCSAAAAAEFSFLLAVPVIAGAALVEGRHMVVSVAAVGAVPLAVSFALAFASGIWSIRFLVALLERGHFYRFAPYNWTVAVLTIVYALWRG